MSLDFYKAMQEYTEVISNKNFRPSGILASVVTSGRFRNDGKFWGEMHGLKFKDNIWNIFQRA